MTLREANFKVEKIQNELTLLYNQKEIMDLSVGVKVSKLDKVLVDGGIVEDKLLNYVYQKKLKRIDEKIIAKERQKKVLMDYIDNELKTLKKYNKVEQLIVFYKDIDLKSYTWFEIGNLVGYSKEQVQRIYKKYRKNKR